RRPAPLAAQTAGRPRGTGAHDHGAAPHPGRRPTAPTRHGHHPPVQGRHLAGQGPAEGLRVRGGDLQVPVRRGQARHRPALQRLCVLSPQRGRRHAMSRPKTPKAAPAKTTTRCAVYTRKSTEEGLEQEFNSLDAQRDAGQNFIKSQVGEGWQCLAEHYDDGGFTGGNMDRPALKRLLADIEAGKIDCVVVYKLDRLSRSLLDFARMLEVFEKHSVSFVSVTQQINS